MMSQTVIGVLMFVVALFLLISAAEGFKDWKANMAATAVVTGSISLIMISVTMCAHAPVLVL